MVEGQAIQQVADGASIKAAPERGSGGIEEFVQSLMPSGFG